MNPNHNFRPSPDSALILSPDPLGAALIGAAVEAAGMRPQFATPDESPRAALRRVRPASVLIGADDPCLRDDAFLGPGKMTGTPMLVFGRERELSALGDVVSRYGLELLVLPRDAADIGSRLTAVIESSRRRPESTAR